MWLSFSGSVVKLKRSPISRNASGAFSIRFMMEERGRKELDVLPRSVRQMDMGISPGAVRRDDMAKRNEKVESVESVESVTRVWKPFAERALARFAKAQEYLAECSPLNLENVKQASAALDAMVVLLKQNPEFAPAVATRSVDFVEGETVGIAEEYAELYYLEVESHGKVERIVRKGEGRGSKIFLSVHFGRFGKRVGPASHFKRI